jgi:hypothetical protein
MNNWVLARNIIIYSELGKILTSFNEFQTPVIVIAGAALAETVYPDISQRPMSDIDLLVHESDLPRIDRILKHNNYALEIIRADERHYHNTHPGFTLHIDLHTRLPYLDTTGLKDIWTRARKQRLSNTDTLILSPEDNIIYIATDAVVYHARITQTNLNDMVFLLQEAEPNFDWMRTVKTIQQYHLKAPLYYMLDLVRQKMGVQIPEWVLQDIRPRDTQRWTLRIYQRLLKPGLVLNDDLAPILRWITRQKRWALLQDSFIPSIDFITRRYRLTHKLLVYFYYPLRILSHIWRVSKSLSHTAKYLLLS